MFRMTTQQEMRRAGRRPRDNFPNRLKLIRFEMGWTVEVVEALSVRG